VVLDIIRSGEFQKLVNVERPNSASDAEFASRLVGNPFGVFPPLLHR
jgi:hypothetical protein